MSSELDIQVVEALGGFVDDPDVGSNTDEVWYWLHKSGGVLRGVAYELGDIDPGWYQRTWNKWHPSEDIAAAWTLVDHLKTRGYSVVIEDYPDASNGGFWRCIFFQVTPIRSGNIIGDALTAPEAICRAFIAVPTEEAARV
jgi:hypothetical protein